MGNRANGSSVRAEKAASGYSIGKQQMENGGGVWRRGVGSYSASMSPNLEGRGGGYRKSGGICRRRGDDDGIAPSAVRLSVADQVADGRTGGPTGERIG